MRIRTNKPRAAFSLVELLLTLVLVLCLAAASVFTFTALYRSANLDEGNDRFQSLIRFAQAEAATTGRKVRLQFVPARSTGEVSDPSSELKRIEVTWEADLLNAPGVFEPYTNKAWSEEMVNELVGIEKFQALPLANAMETGVLTPLDSSAENIEFGSAPKFDSVTFYPDGSCDSAQIVLASRNSEDVRRVEVRLGGMLGSVTTRTMSPEQVQGGEPVDDEFSDYEALSESPDVSYPGGGRHTPTELSLTTH